MGKEGVIDAKELARVAWRSVTTTWGYALITAALLTVAFLAYGVLAALLLLLVAAVGLGYTRRVAETAEATVDEAKEHTTQTLTRLGTAQREQSVMRERARIARELHDVVAHSVSMIAVQAETAPYTMRDLSPEAGRGFTEIAGAAREALTEMRRLLTVLRADAATGPTAGPETSPQPNLDRLPDLIEQHRGAGGLADISVHGSPRALSATVELSAYRIVQESLTNARRHAPGSRVRVELSYQADKLAVRVTDDGAGRGGADVRPAAADPDRGGHGLVGMRERATMLGGRFSAGAGPGGGFAVEAELPVSRRDPSNNDPRTDRR